MEPMCGSSSCMDRVVLTVGTFDVPHLGHARFLYQASRLGYLIVGVNTDAYVEAYKGAKPIFNYEARSNLIHSLPFVESVVSNDRDDLKPLIELVACDFLVIGSDWGDRYYKQAQITQKYLDEYGVSMYYIPYTKGISTTEIKRRLHA